MATGYSEIIKQGATFEEYIMKCARAFGALIMMRDDPFDATIPAQLPLSMYHYEALFKERDRLAEALSYSEEKWEEILNSEYHDHLEYYEESIQKKEIEIAQFNAMLEKVENWTPPSPDHENLKDFMRSQIVETIDWDYKYASTPPKKQNIHSFIEKRIKNIEESIEYHKNHHIEEFVNTMNRNHWIDILRKAIQNEKN